MSKTDNLKQLYDRYKNEFKEYEVVVGDGNIEAKILLIGEAPGKDEVKLSKPFVGMAGRNLNEFLDILTIEREAIYITNAIKFRLSQVNPQTGRIVNRPATKDEITINKPYLLEEISIIKPCFIVTLGNVPLKSVTGDSNASIGALHGKIKVIDILQSEYKLYPLYHPASIIYNKSLKDTYINDIIKLKELISQSEF